MEKLTEMELKSLQDLVKKQDQNAFVVGVATIEWFQNVINMVNKVNKTKEDQKKLGETLLKLHGCDPEQDNYTINQITGEIMKLETVNGKAEYVSIELKKEG